MASGDSLVYFGAQDAILPNTGYATFQASNNGDLALSFNSSGDIATFRGVMPRNYSGATGITLNLNATKTTTSTGLIAWAASFEDATGYATGSNAFGVDSFGTCQVTAGLATTSTSLQFLNYPLVVANAALGGVGVAGSVFRLRISAASSDGNAAKRYLTGIEIEET